MSLSIQSFDLGNLAKSADRARRFRVAQGIFVLALGAALITLGGFFFFAPPAATLSRYSTGPLIFMLMGGVIVAAGTWEVTRLGPSARRLIVTPQWLALEDIPRNEPVRLEWKRGNFKLDIHDFRDIRKADPKSQSRGYDIVLHPPRGPETAIPSSAYDAILLEANVQGLSLSQRAVNIGAKAPMIVTTIRSALLRGT